MYSRAIDRIGEKDGPYVVLVYRVLLTISSERGRVDPVGSESLVDPELFLRPLRSAHYIRLYRPRITLRIRWLREPFVERGADSYASNEDKRCQRSRDCHPA